MKNQILGIFICMLLISSTTTLALTPFSKDERQMKNQFFNTIPVPLPKLKGWVKTFGGTGYDIGYSVQQTMDGGYIIVGETDSFGVHGDIWVIKTDEDGNKVWDKTLGGINRDYYPDVKQTNDNGFIITAKTYSFGAGEIDIWVVKLDEDGTEQWNTTFGKEFWDYSSEIQQTSDGGYIVVGSLSSNEPLLYDAWLIKIDGEGNEEWNRTFGGTPLSWEFGQSVQQTSDGGYIVAASTIPYGGDGYDFWLIRTNERGNEQWNRTYGDDYSWGGAVSVELTSDGGYISMGTRQYYDTGLCDIWIVKTNQYGDEQWNKKYGGVDDDYGSHAYQTSDGGYVIIGVTQSFGAGAEDVWMIKTDAYGDEQWNRTYGGKSSDGGLSIDLTTDGGYIITGGKGSGINETYTSDVWLIKTDGQGKSKTLLSVNLRFERWFERFPNVYPLIQQVLGY